jgi:hypothetical protein
MIAFLLANVVFSIFVSFEYRLTLLLFSPERISLAFSQITLRMGEIVLAIIMIIINFVIYAVLATPPTRLDCRLGLDAPFVVSAEDVAQYT